VLFTSGYANAAVVHQGRLDPGVELPKPFTYAALASKLRRMQGHGGAGRSEEGRDRPPGAIAGVHRGEPDPQA
jgi:hypothetical protein